MYLIGFKSNLIDFKDNWEIESNIGCKLGQFDQVKLRKYE